MANGLINDDQIDPKPAAEAHAANHSDGSTDEVIVENLAAGGSEGQPIVVGAAGAVADGMVNAKAAVASAGPISAVAYAVLPGGPVTLAIPHAGDYLVSWACDAIFNGNTAGDEVFVAVEDASAGGSPLAGTESKCGSLTDTGAPNWAAKIPMGKSYILNFTGAATLNIIARRVGAANVPALELLTLHAIQIG